MDRFSIKIMKIHSSRFCMAACYGLIDFQYFDSAKLWLNWKSVVCVYCVVYYFYGFCLMLDLGETKTRSTKESLLKQFHCSENCKQSKSELRHLCQTSRNRNLTLTAE